MKAFRWNLDNESVLKIEEKGSSVLLVNESSRDTNVSSIKSGHISLDYEPAEAGSGDEALLSQHLWEFIDVRQDQGKRAGRPSQRKLIIGHAILLADSQGPKGFTLDKVAESSRISKGGVLYHFSNVPELVWDMFEVYFSLILKRSGFNSESGRGLTISTISELLRSVPTRPNLEMLFLKNALENVQLSPKAKSLRRLINASDSEDKILLYSALGFRLAKLYNLVQEDLNL